MALNSIIWLLGTITALFLAMYFESGTSALFELLAFICAICAAFSNMHKKRTSS